MTGQDKKVKIEIQNPVPWITVLLLFILFLTFFAIITNYNGNLSLKEIRTDWFLPSMSAQSWMDRMGVQSVEIYKQAQEGKYLDVMGRFFYSSFASFSFWQLVLQAYFLWGFGAPVEQKMGGARILILAAISIFVPWAVLCFERLNVLDSTTYYGSLFFLSGLIGAGMVFPEEKEINTQWFRKTRGEIFRRDERKSPAEKYKAKTKLIFIAFVIFEIGSYFYSQQFTPGYMTFHLVPLFVSMLIGYIITLAMVWSATGDLKEGALKLMVIRRYNDMLKLDVSHDLAIRGTSLALGLPEDRVKLWIRQQKGKMKVS